MSRTLLTYLLFAMTARAAELKIDHCTVAGPHLEEMRKAFTAATRIPTEYGGPHSNHATEMALASFPDGSYIELMGLQQQADPAAVKTHTWSQFLRDNGGPCAFALRVPDVGAEVQRLSTTGIHVGAPEKSGRTRPDGVALSWETADVGSGVRGTFFPFLIRDVTSREKRVYPSGNPTTTAYRGVAAVVLGVRNLEKSIAEYRKAFGLAEPKQQRDHTLGVDLAWFEGTPVILASSAAPGSWLEHRIAQLGEAPCAFLLLPAGGMTGYRPSRWFDKALFWLDETNLGWRLGVWMNR